MQGRLVPKVQVGPSGEGGNVSASPMTTGKTSVKNEHIVNLLNVPFLFPPLTTSVYSLLPNIFLMPNLCKVKVTNVATNHNFFQWSGASKLHTMWPLAV